MIEFYGGYQVYSESGVDLTLLRENLKRPLEERIQRNAGAVRLIQALHNSRWTRFVRAATAQEKPSMIELAGLLRRLAAHRVEYVLIGGWAMVAHGSGCPTQDLDICYSRCRENLDGLVAALDPLHPRLRGAPLELPFRFDALTLQAGLNFALVTDVGDLDLLGEVPGLGAYEQVVAQSEPRKILDFELRVLSLDGLIAAKRAAGRLKDQLHLRELESLKALRDAQQ